jgi:excinuclease ABC subunit A
VLCVVTGVSGSGKSSLVQETLYPALLDKLTAHAAQPEAIQSATVKRGKPNPEESADTNAAAAAGVHRVADIESIGEFDTLTGWEQLDAVMLVDQRPIGRSPRANPATYLNVFGEIRTLFAGTAEAKVRNLPAAQFSFNTAAGGRCPTCRGDGVLAVDLQFLPDVTMTCPDCHGTRYRRDLLDVKYRGLNIAEVLALTIREAFPFFRGRSKLQRRLKHAKDVGLDYLTLGQPANTLSGGESQRLKLAAHLARGTRARTLFVLDEPTTGLHPADVERLLECLRSLLAAGHSVIAIEHNLDLIRAADYVIDLGPEAGPEGGRIIAAGTPEEVARSPASLTGRSLQVP